MHGHAGSNGWEGATIVDVRCRLFASEPSDGGAYANPLRAWTGTAAGERAFQFQEWLIVEVELAGGEVGLGNAALAPRLTARIVTDHLRPQLVGADATEREAIWQRMYRSIVAFGRRGAGMAAVSAVDIALWDVAGKRLGVPVHDLLGGRKRERIPVYASQLYFGGDLDALAAEARGYRDDGFGMVKQRFLWGPADGSAGMRRNVELVRTVRDAIGDEVELAADAYMGWDLDYARRMVRLLEPYDLRWIEEPLLPDDLAGYRALTAESPIPIAAGEHEATLGGFHELIAGGLVNVAQPDVNRVGGLTVAQKVCALAEAAGVPVVPHAGQAHNYHLVASQPACPLAEYFPVSSEPEVGNEMPHLLFAGEPRASDGSIELARIPGLGIAIEPRDGVREVPVA
jgi:L-alanine-DL-glutamate epimerase-like enolase superfamily enzyme